MKNLPMPSSIVDGTATDDSTSPSCIEGTGFVAIGNVARRAFETLVFVSLITIAACSSNSTSATVTEAGFSSLLTIEDLGQVATQEISPNVTLLDFKKLAENVDPKQVADVDSWYGRSYAPVSGSSDMTFSLIDFDSERAAKDRFDILRSEFLQAPRLSGSAAVTVQEMDPPIGEASIAVPANAGGIGSMVIFRTDDKLVQLHTTLPQGAEALVSIEGLQSLARIIEERQQGRA